MFRFLHTADWHLGKPFGHVPGDAGAALRAQRVATVRRIAELAAAREADAVLVAGDAFDGNEVSDATLRWALEALAPFRGTWVFLPGNHDAATAHSVWTRLRAFGPPANVIIADEPRAVDAWGGRAVVLPAPLRRRREADDLTRWFDGAASPDGCRRIGLAHGSLAGRLPEARPGDILADRAARAGLCYLAMGDWHGALKVAPRTYYAGTPEPDRHKDNDHGLVHLVTIEGQGAAERVERLEAAHYCWVHREVELLGSAGPALDALAALARAPSRCVVSLRLAGTITLPERHRLDRALEEWGQRLRHLDVDDAGLTDVAALDDLDAIDAAGFVRAALERLRARAGDREDPERDAAGLALRMAFLDHRATTRA